MRYAIEHGQMPRYLYKYWSTSSVIRFLGNHKIMFSQYTDFNDPFECAANIDANNSAIEWADYLASQGVVMREDPFIPKGEAISEVTKEDNTKEATPAIENAPQVTNTVETQTQQVVTSNPPQANVAAGVSANAQNNNELEIVEM